LQPTSNPLRRCKHNTAYNEQETPMANFTETEPAPQDQDNAKPDPNPKPT
jgi:hypothetical protein